jgi:predicted  nucleic acid-binding Zn-ribbon protein
MKATQNQQSDALALAALDLEISRTSVQIKSLTDPTATASLRQAAMELSGSLIEARNVVDSVELELQRAETDLKLVEDRIAKDNVRLNSTQSSKDAQGIQSELATLATRKSNLEDVELAILEKLDEARAAYDLIAGEKSLRDADLKAREAEIEQELIKLRSGLDLSTQSRAKQAAGLPQELLEAYTKKATRGIPVARLLGRECGACRITLGASAFAEVTALPKDEFASCPDCQALLVR